MKKITIALIAIVTIILLATIVNTMPYYTMRYCTVVNQEGTVVTFEDNTGNLWEFRCDANDRYEPNEVIKAKMHDGWTDYTNLDDKVIEIERW